jgi:hypothetical protein
MSTELARPSGALLRTVASALIPEIESAPSDAILVLSIRIDDEHLVARDLAAFMELLDHVYGRAQPGQFSSYARREHGHFTFSRCKSGSWELIVEQVLDSAGSSSPLVVLWLVLKYLPSIVLSLAQSYNQVEQGRLARANRQRIREEIERSNELSQLPKNQRAEIARIVNAVAEQEATLMPRVRRFMRRSFLSITAHVRSRDLDES